MSLGLPKSTERPESIRKSSLIGIRNISPFSLLLSFSLFQLVASIQL